MRIVLGLGNPGERYRRTRHNLGVLVAERFARREGVRFRDGEGDRWSWTVTLQHAGMDVVLARPKTFMNRSGTAAAELCRRHDATPGDLLVIHDDADLALGRVRIRARGGDGGHNGVGSIIEALGTDGFGRIKLGVRGEGRAGYDLADYVLEEFDEDELPAVESLVALGADALSATLEIGITAAMNRFNPLSAIPDENRATEE